MMINGFMQKLNMADVSKRSEILKTRCDECKRRKRCNELDKARGQACTDFEKTKDTNTKH